MFSEEGHFYLNGFVSKHNCRIWSNENSYTFEETSLHLKKLVVSRGIIGQYFFGNGQKERVTVEFVIKQRNRLLFPIFIEN